MINSENILEHDVTEEEFNDIMSEEEFKKFQEESDKKVIKKLNEKYKLLEEFDARWDLLPLELSYEIFTFKETTDEAVDNYNKYIMQSFRYCLASSHVNRENVRNVLIHVLNAYIIKHYCTKRDALEMLARYCGRIQELYFEDAILFDDIYSVSGNPDKVDVAFYINKAIQEYYEDLSLNYVSIHEVSFMFYVMSAIYYIDTHEKIKKEG